MPQTTSSRRSRLHQHQHPTENEPKMPGKEGAGKYHEKEKEMLREKERKKIMLLRHLVFICAFAIAVLVIMTWRDGNKVKQCNFSKVLEKYGLLPFAENALNISKDANDRCHMWVERNAWPCVGAVGKFGCNLCKWERDTLITLFNFVTKNFSIASNYVSQYMPDLTKLIKTFFAPINKLFNKLCSNTNKLFEDQMSAIRLEKEFLLVADMVNAAIAVIAIVVVYLSLASLFFPNFFDGSYYPLPFKCMYATKRATESKKSTELKSATESKTSDDNQQGDIEDLSD